MTRILVPAPMVDADWGDAEVVGYDWHDVGDLVHDSAEVLVAGYGPHDATFRLADELPGLRFVQTTYAGVETWQDRLAPHVLLGNTRDAFGPVTAELATASLVALLRGLPTMVHQQRDRVWALVRGESLVGKRVLLVGTGGVGRHLRVRLEAFGATVTSVGRSARDGVHAVDALPALLPQADVLVLAVPLTAETRGLVDAAVLAALPDRAVVVNVARGPVVVTDALGAEVAAGRLRAVLDVTDPEPLPADHPLWSLPDVLITPHVGGAVDQGIAAGVEEAAAQVAAYCSGGTPTNLVSRVRPGEGVPA